MPGRFALPVSVQHELNSSVLPPQQNPIALPARPAYATSHALALSWIAGLNGTSHSRAGTLHIQQRIRSMNPDRSPEGATPLAARAVGTVLAPSRLLSRTWDVRARLIYLTIHIIRVSSRSPPSVGPVPFSWTRGCARRPSPLSRSIQTGTPLPATESNQRHRRPAAS